jgi:hypothetical protein
MRTFCPLHPFPKHVESAEPFMLLLSANSPKNFTPPVWKALPGTKGRQISPHPYRHARSLPIL